MRNADSHLPPAVLRGLHALLHALWLVALLFPATSAAQPQSVEEIGAQVERLSDAGRYTDAAQLAEAALMLATERFGPDHVETGHALYRLGDLQRNLGKLEVAQAFTQRALAIYEAAYGAQHAHVAKALTLLARVRAQRGDIEAGLTMAQRAVETYEAVLGTDHPDLASALNALSYAHFSVAKYDLAESTLQRALAIAQKAHGEAHRDVAQALHLLALVRWELGDFTEAEARFRRALDVHRAAHGAEHPARAQTMVMLAGMYRDLEREDEAEKLLRAGLAIQEKAHGAESPVVAVTLIHLGIHFGAQARYEEAEPLFQRAIAIFDAAGMPDHSFAASALGNLATVFHSQGRLTESEPLFRRALAIKEKSHGAEHPDVASVRYSLAVVRFAQGRPAEAEALVRNAIGVYEKHGIEVHDAYELLGRVLIALGREDEALATFEKSYAGKLKTFGAQHPGLAVSHVGLGRLAMRRARFEDARVHFAKAVELRVGAWGAQHVEVATALDLQAQAEAALGRTEAALLSARRASALLAARFGDATAHAYAGLRAEQRYLSGIFAHHVALLERNRSGQDTGETQEALRVAQLARASDTAAQVARMAARSATGSDRLAQLARQRQDMENRLTRSESDLLAQWSRPADAGTAARIATLHAQRDQVQRDLAQLDATLLREFPRYRELIDPRPLEVAEIQALLGSREALVSYLVAEEGVFVWVVKRQSALFRRLPTDRAKVDASVRELRLHLDPAGDASAVLRRAFPLTTAFDLYRTLLAPVDAALAGVQHLVIVPDGPLLGLPFGVLVTQHDAASGTALPSAAWLVKRHALSTLPAESSLRALRALGARAKVREPFAGFGDPLLEGTPGLRGSVPVALRARGAVADVREVRRLPRLPDTADELKSIGASLKAPADAIFLRERATEEAVKRRDLRRYRTLAFATHGLLAGELEGLAEPALVLTPPSAGTEDDDGLLTMSEIAQLSLNSEWVILSACNTGGDDGRPDAAGLSGLAKAFFYAGARSLLVSHWAVSSEATVLLTTGMFRHYAAGTSKAEALRRSMLELMQRKGKLPYAHPMLWAPFVIVGEGERE